jgi:hypothetical protein
MVEAAAEPVVRCRRPAHTGVIRRPTPPFPIVCRASGFASSRLKAAAASAGSCLRTSGVGRRAGGLT